MKTGAQIAGELAGHVSLATVICRDEPLAKHTTLRVGGPADVYVEPASETDLAAVVNFAGNDSLPFFVMGRGSNLLVRDGGFRGVVICLAQPNFSRIEGGRRTPALRRGSEIEKCRGRGETERSERRGISGRHSRQRRRRVAHERGRDGRRDVRCRRVGAVHGSRRENSRTQPGRNAGGISLLSAAEKSHCAGRGVQMPAPRRARKSSSA